MSTPFNPADYPRDWYFLQPGTIVDQYIIERPLAGGGFSSVYLARQRADQYQVAIKEYLPKRLAHRTWGNRIVPNDDSTRRAFVRGRKLFFEEAKVLAGLRHPNIVEVLNFFEANSTVYLVMTYDYGKALGKFLRHGYGKMTEQFALTVFPPLLSGLALIHSKGLLHLDIKPQNILIRPGPDPLLLDFGAVQPYPYEGQAKTGTVLSAGFSPIEQYTQSGKLGPWSDIYAVGATMRMCLEGHPPPPAPQRQIKDTLIPAAKAFKRRLPAYLLDVIDAAMSLEPEDRPPSAEAMRDLLLSGSQSAAGV